MTEVTLALENINEKLDTFVKEYFYFEDTAYDKHLNNLSLVNVCQRNLGISTLFTIEELSNHNTTPYIISDSTTLGESTIYIRLLQFINEIIVKDFPDSYRIMRQLEKILPYDFGEVFEWNRRFEEVTFTDYDGTVATTSARNYLKEEYLSVMLYLCDIIEEKENN